MKIGIVHGNFEHIAGIENVCLWIARHLMDRGHQVTIFTGEVGKIDEEFSDIPFELVPELAVGLRDVCEGVPDGHPRGQGSGGHPRPVHILPGLHRDLPGGQGGNSEAGSREISVRKFTCDRVPLWAPV